MGVIAMILEFLFGFIITFFIVLILSYIGQRIIVNRSRLDKKTFLVVVIQSLVIALIFTIF